MQRLLVAARGGDIAISLRDEIDDGRGGAFDDARVDSDHHRA
jgi:hypothetical protein